VRTSLARSDFQVFADARVFATGVALGRETASESEIIERMNTFTHKTERAGLRTYAFELATRSLASAALGAGFDYISGAAIGTLVDAPERAYRFETVDLYADILRGD
jgi:hypothetical protein